MSIHRERVARATHLMGEHRMDALILVKPANMDYLVGDEGPRILTHFPRQLLVGV